MAYGVQVAFASMGRPSLFPDDSWGTTYQVDVTLLFKTEPGETLLPGNTHAHSIRDGGIGGNEGLVRSGQLFLPQ